MNYKSASDIAAAIASGNLTSVEITEHYLANIARYNDTLHAFVDVFENQARSQAKQRDATPANQRGPLHGVPISIKECFLMAGTRTTLNYPPLKDFRATTTSMLVERLINAGAVILGKTNVPTLLSDGQTFGPVYPTSNNPYDLKLTPGGSTGGGAAALAADMTALELGSDIGGSIRNPSNFCGLFGLKPTENGHAFDGHVPPLPDKQLGASVMNSTGPLARSAADLQLAYSILYAPDWQGLHYLPVTPQQPAPEHLKDFKFGYLDSLYGIQPGHDVRTAMDTMQAKLEATGASVEKITIDPQLAKRLLLLWVELFGYVMGQNLSWAIRKVFFFSFRRALKDSSLNATAAFKRGLKLDFRGYSRALAERNEIIAQINQLYAPYHAVLSPTSLGPAFPHNHKHGPIMLDGEAVPYVDYCFLYVALYNLTGQPVLTVPAGPQSSGLPVGLSFAGHHHHESLLLKLGQLLDDAQLTHATHSTPAGLQTHAN